MLCGPRWRANSNPIRRSRCCAQASLLCLVSTDRSPSDAAVSLTHLSALLALDLASGGAGGDGDGDQRQQGDQRQKSDGRGRGAHGYGRRSGWKEGAWMAQAHGPQVQRRAERSAVSRAPRVGGAADAPRASEPSSRLGRSVAQRDRQRSVPRASIQDTTDGRPVPVCVRIGIGIGTLALPLDAGDQRRRGRRSLSWIASSLPSPMHPSPSSLSSASPVSSLPVGTCCWGEVDASITPGTVGTETEAATKK